jgi:hypothetical protein
MALSTPALAADGRAVTPEGEITANYIHSLDRRPDTGGWNTYINEVNQDCRRGVMRMSYDLLVSTEARTHWDPKPAPLNETLTGALFASLFDRAARDSQEFWRYGNIANGRGFPLAVTTAMATREYKDRLARICAGRKATNGTMQVGTDAMNTARGLTDVAKTLAKACGVALLTNNMLKLWGVPKPAVAINAAARLAMQYAGVSKACLATGEVLYSAAYLAQLAGDDYSVYVSIEQRTTGPFYKRICHSRVGVGSDPSGGVRYRNAEWRC